MHIPGVLSQQFLLPEEGSIAPLDDGHLPGAGKPVVHAFLLLKLSLGLFEPEGEFDFSVLVLERWQKHVGQEVFARHVLVGLSEHSRDAMFAVGRD